LIEISNKHRISGTKFLIMLKEILIRYEWFTIEGTNDQSSHVMASLTDFPRVFAAGAEYAKNSAGVENTVFNGDREDNSYAKTSYFSQRFIKLRAWEQFNATDKINGSVKLQKTVDYLGQCHVVMRRPGVSPPINQGITHTSWINGLGCFYQKGIHFRVSNQDFYRSNGHQILLKLDLTGQLVGGTYGRHVGFFLNPEQLIIESKKSTTLFIPLNTFPFFEGADKSFPIAAAHWHELSFEFETRSVQDCVINYQGALMKNKGIMSLPFEIGTAKSVDNSSIQMWLSSQYTLVEEDEKQKIRKGETDAVVSEWVSAVGIHSVSPNASKQKVNVPFPAKGPIRTIIATITSRQDNERGLWFKHVSDYGNRYCESAIIHTGNTATEDPMPAEWNESIVPERVFGVNARRSILVWSFENDARSKQHNGFRCFTNVENPSIEFDMNPHSDTLDITIDYIEYNGQWSQGFNIGKYWS
jgi:Major capsid protein N-terminus